MKLNIRKCSVGDIIIQKLVITIIFSVSRTGIQISERILDNGDIFRKHMHTGPALYFYMT